MSTTVLSRDEFRTLCLKRDGFKCVVCGEVEGVHVHHLVERRLFGSSGGYFLSNGVSVCETHHLLAESTILSCDELRTLCGITTVVLPEHLYADQPYDKWGNPILPNGQRLKGELFHDESVQKIMKPALHLFTNRVKHPRTNHLPWSCNISSDDKIIPSLSGFDGEEVVVTVKMDGENTSMYRDGFHARSIDTPAHPSRDWLWGIHRRIGHEIPEGWRLCAENLFAKHSIYYKNLISHLLVFSIWNEKNICLSWDDTVAYAELLGLHTVPILYRGMWDESHIKALQVDSYNGDPAEGYVVRVAREFQYKDFRNVVAKNVRRDHVQTHGHWMRQAIEKNLLAGNM